LLIAAVRVHTRWPLDRQPLVYLHRFDARERGSGWAAIDATTTPS
jgi:hypothetical protein